MIKPLTFQHVFNYFISYGCILLSTEYINSRQILNFICSCGNHNAKITFPRFKKSKHCKKCGIKQKSKKQAHSLEYISSIFKKEDCILISTEYKNNVQILDFICSCGNPSKITYSTFKESKHCKKCGIKQRSKKRAHSLEYVKNKFEKEYCTLISVNYINSNQLLDYICSCGNQSKISFSSFSLGRRCKKCNLEKQQKNSYFWKDYILPSGKIIKVQGYEPQALDYLLENIYLENEIITQKRNIPTIQYFTLDDKKHKYYPDFYIPKDNLIIEVKSTWTWKCKLQKNLLKIKATIDAGYKFQLMIL